MRRLVVVSEREGGDSCAEAVSSNKHGCTPCLPPELATSKDRVSVEKSMRVLTADACVEFELRFKPELQSIVQESS